MLPRAICRDPYCFAHMPALGTEVQAPHACRCVQAAASRGEEGRAMALLTQYHEAGGQKQLWMFDMLINMHARKRNLPAALSVRDLMRDLDVQPSTCAPSHRAAGKRVVAASAELLRQAQSCCGERRVVAASAELLRRAQSCCGERRVVAASTELLRRAQSCCGERRVVAASAELLRQAQSCCGERIVVRPCHQRSAGSRSVGGSAALCARAISELQGVAVLGEVQRCAPAPRQRKRRARMHAAHSRPTARHACRYVYSSLLVACAHSRPTGYNAPREAVAAAEALLAEMAARGVQRDFAVQSILLDVYAKAGMCAPLACA